MLMLTKMLKILFFAVPMVVLLGPAFGSGMETPPTTTDYENWTNETAYLSDNLQWVIEPKSN
ncbi:MAG: hypothetical protein ACERKZ_13015 [Lachnotalea sp.]